MTKVFNSWSEYDDWLKINVMHISVSQITSISSLKDGERLLVTYEDKNDTDKTDETV